MFSINNENKLNQLCDTITSVVTSHHKIYDLPVLGEYWENVLSKSLKANGIDNDWTPDLNHVQGLDMIIEDKLRVSCKSGQIMGKEQNDLKFSGSRMTKYKTLEDKLNYLSVKKEDVYMLLSRSKKDWDKGERKYSFIAFPSDILQYNSMNWVDTFATKGSNAGKLNGHKASNEVLDANISFSCSHQLWTKIKDFKDNKNIFIKEISV